MVTDGSVIGLIGGFGEEEELREGWSRHAPGKTTEGPPIFLRIPSRDTRNDQSALVVHYAPGPVRGDRLRCGLEAARTSSKPKQ
jgi:hypothetical protein